MKNLIGRLPVIGPLARHVYREWIKPPEPFAGSDSYWKNRYDSGGNSGNGSYRQLAEFKAEVLNEFVRENAITSVIEYGCGDGNQLGLADYPRYVGFDISPTAVSACTARFAQDRSKTFCCINDYQGETADLTLSLDVIYHLTEDAVFTEYMGRLFDSSQRFVIIYSSDTEDNSGHAAPHVKHRKFSTWVANNRSGWALVRHIPNRYPFNGDNRTSSFADFYIYARKQARHD